MKLHISKTFICPDTIYHQPLSNGKDTLLMADKFGDFVSYSNTPVTGCKIVRYNAESMGISDPRGWTVKVSPKALDFILNNHAYDPVNGLSCYLVYAWDNNKLVPVPCTLSEYSEYKTQLNNVRMYDLNELEIGKYYQSDSISGWYLGSTYVGHVESYYKRNPGTMDYFNISYKIIHMFYRSGHHKSIAFSKSKFIKRDNIVPISKEQIKTYRLRHFNDTMDPDNTPELSTTRIDKFRFMDSEEKAVRFVEIPDITQYIQDINAVMCPIQALSADEKILYRFQPVGPDLYLMIYNAEIFPELNRVIVNNINKNLQYTVDELKEKFSGFQFYYMPSLSVYSANIFNSYAGIAQIVDNNGHKRIYI